MSLAIANQMLKYVWLPEYKKSTEKPFGTIDYFVTKIRKAVPEKFVIGEHNVY